MTDGSLHGIERHHRVYIRSGSPLSGVARDAVPLLRTWAEAGRPFVARRAEHQAAQGMLPLAWQSGTSMKIAFAVPFSAVTQHAPPLPLAMALPVFPPALANALTRLDADAARLGMTLRLYGSWFWQAVSGEICTTPRSDIDLLFAPGSIRQLESGLALLMDAAASLPLDGEAVFPGGWGVAWRELAQHPDAVLARNRASATLLPRAQLVSVLREAA